MQIEHNYLTLSIILGSCLGLIQIWLTWQVVKLRGQFKQAVGAVKEEIYDRKNGALSNFTANLPIVMALFILAENNRANCGLLLFIGGYYLLARLAHIYSLYRYESKTGKFRLRIFGMTGTFAVILALVAVNLYILATHSPS